MSFHDVSAPPRRKNQQPHTDGLLVQRKCACGTHTGEPECEDCKKKQTIQRRDQTDSLDPLVRSAGFDLTGIDTHAPASPVTEAAPDTAAPARPATLIVDDAVAELEPGQLRKTEFLDRLRPAVCAEVELALAGTGRSTADCPYLDRWFTYYRGQSSDHVESAIQRYAPETRNARTAADYIALVAARARQGAERWASTGDLSGIPEGMSLGMAGGLGGLMSGIGGLLFAAREGGARADDPATVRAQLGSGRPLDSGVRSRMESAFGQSFAHVRTHTDTTGSRLSAAQNAKAFTVGEHIAFGTGEYHPGTIVGDALIAHELAHVTQQSGTGATANHAALEQDADRSAAGAVAALFTGTSTGSGTLRTRTGSGLRLQRCGGTQVRPQTTATATPKTTGGGLTCPPLPAPPPGFKGRTGQDARALSIIAIATDTKRPVEERAKEAVLQIICQYYPDGPEKINQLTYNEDTKGFDITTSVGKDKIIRADLVVGKEFIEGKPKPIVSDKLTPEERLRKDFAMRYPKLVLSVGHEIMHVDQWRSGMTGEDETSDKREFLASYWVATAPEKPGTGKMQHGTRVEAIDFALGYYNCLSPETQKVPEYLDKQKELLKQRPGYITASGREDFDPAPTECRRKGDPRKRPEKSGNKEP